MNETQVKLQVESELDIDLLTSKVCVRIKYRELPRRKWTSLVVVPDEGQTPVEVMRHAEEIAILHKSRIAA